MGHLHYVANLLTFIPLCYGSVMPGPILHWLKRTDTTFDLTQKAEKLLTALKALASELCSFGNCHCFE